MTCTYAALGGKIDCLRYAHQNGGPLDRYLVACAASGGSVDCLRYALDNGCVWDSSICFYAARDGRSECLKYALENGCPVDTTTIWNAFSWSATFHIECFKILCSQGYRPDRYHAYKDGTVVDALIIKLMMEDIIDRIRRSHAAIVIQTEFRRRVSCNPHHEFGRNILLKSFALSKLDV